MQEMSLTGIKPAAGPTMWPYSMSYLVVKVLDKGICTLKWISAKCQCGKMIDVSVNVLHFPHLEEEQKRDLSSLLLFFAHVCLERLMDEVVSGLHLDKAILVY